MFCKDCGNEIKDNAVICVNCGVAIVGNKSNKKPHISVPIISLIFGLFGIVTFFDPSYWDYDTIIGCIILYSLPSIILGIISILRNHQGKGMGIAGLIMGGISFFYYISLL